MSELLKKYLNDLKNMLDENGVAPTKAASAETHRMSWVFYTHGLKWSDAVHRVGGVTKQEYSAKRNGEDACKMAGVLPRKEASTDRESYPAHQTEEPIRGKKSYRGEFKQCRNCYWHDGNGYCPAPRGRCYKAPHKSVDYGTFKQQEVIT